MIDFRDYRRAAHNAGTLGSVKKLAVFVGLFVSLVVFTSPGKDLLKPEEEAPAPPAIIVTKTETAEQPAPETPEPTSTESVAPSSTEVPSTSTSKAPETTRTEPTGTRTTTTVQPTPSETTTSKPSLPNFLPFPGMERTTPSEQPR